MTWTDDLIAFHEAFGHPAPTTPTFDEIRVDLREKLMKEELEETMDAIRAGDMVEAADGLADLIYVTVGTAVELGIRLEDIFRVVQRSNMAKLGPDGKPITREDGKSQKPPGWKPPTNDIKRELEFQGWTPPV
jgi:predicted HAD superfamily Cof-like phosphohydrolase